MRTVTCELELKEDRTVIITLPDDIPVGKHQAVLVIDEHAKDDLGQQETMMRCCLRPAVCGSRAMA